jgi:molybdopterin synthase sulfur carrier subunit
MAVTVRIPTPLRTLTGGADEVPAEGGTVAEVIENLEANHPGMKERLCDDKGVRRFVNLYANDEDIRFLDNLETTLKDGDTLSIVPAIAGGSTS